ncbi:hypothetical protein HK099_004746, partial [Clydaea vesicula]
MSNIPYNSPQTDLPNYSAPPKYIRVNGITKLNPEYTKYQQKNNLKPTSLKNAQSALPIISNMNDYASYNDSMTKTGASERPLAETTDTSIQFLQSAELKQRLGINPEEELVDVLCNLFAKYEAPMGLITKLFELERFDALEFIIDDSGSMTLKTDSMTAYGVPQTRWGEAIERLKTMIEVLAYVPCQLIQIKFLNRREVITVKHFHGQPPQAFIKETYSLLDAVAADRPSGTTPAFAALSQSINEGAGRKIARYFFGDGEPNSGEIPRIEQLVKYRNNPKDNPITFFSCTGDDAQVEWMKELEEVAPYCAEYDDYNDEREEVLRDQGAALPFSRGFYLIGQLIAVLNPLDLDAMDESIPFTKYNLDQLLGVNHTVEEYKHYFHHFCLAQSTRQVESEFDRIKKKFNWNQYYLQFLNERNSNTFPVVIHFKQQLSHPYGGTTHKFFPSQYNKQQSPNPYARGGSQYQKRNDD